MRGYYLKVMHVQNTFRKHKLGLNLRLNHFTKVLWEKEKQFLMKQCLVKKASKVKQGLVKKLSMIDDRVIEAIGKVYMKRCVLRFQARFLEWRLDYKMKRVADHVVRPYRVKFYRGKVNQIRSTRKRKCRKILRNSCS